MSNIKYSKKFIVKGNGILPRSYVIHRSFHQDYDILHRWLNSDSVKLAKEFVDPALHCIAFGSDEDEKIFLSFFGENVK